MEKAKLIRMDDNWSQKKAKTSKRIKVSYSFLTENFYRGSVKTVTQEELVKLSEFAKTIAEASSYGKYIDDAHYLKAMDLLLHSTEETPHRATFFLKKVLPILSQKNAILDIGPGNGEITTLVGQEFEQITLLDICKTALENLNEDNFKNCQNLTKLHGSVLNVPLSANRYDLVILSHMLYYIDRSQWIKVTKKAFDSVKKYGLMVIVMGGDALGKGDLISHFAGSSLDIEGYIQECAEQLFCKSIEVFVSNEKFSAIDLNTMLHIAGFLLYDKSVSVTKENLALYLEKHCKKRQNLYEISTRQKFILIKK